MPPEESATDAAEWKAALRSPQARPLRVWLTYADHRALQRGALGEVATFVARRVRFAVGLALLATVVLACVAIVAREEGQAPDPSLLLYAVIPVAVATVESLRVRRALRALHDRSDERES